MHLPLFRWLFPQFQLFASNKPPESELDNNTPAPRPYPAGADSDTGSARHWQGLNLLLILAALLGGRSQLFAQLPAGWSDFDVGFPSQPGSASYANGNWTVSGGGDDIWNNADNFHYACEGATDDAVIIARVTAVQATDPWAKAGVMFRDSGDASATFANVVATPGNGVNFQWRNSYGGGCGYSQVGGINTPIWVKLVKTGNDFSGFYSLDGGAWTPIGPDQLIPMSSAPLAGLCVTAHNDALLNTSTFDSVTVSNVPPPPPPVFGVYRELWDNLDPSIGNVLDVLTNTAYNPNWPDNPDPSYTKTYSYFEADANTGMNYYGQRMRALVVPPATGSYTFWISSDDSSELFLSTDESPVNMTPLCWVASWTNPREWTKEPNQQSAPVQLQAGRRYYLEAIMQQGNGGDNLAVRWQIPGATIEEPLPSNSSLGTRMVPCRGVDDPPGVYQQPTNLTVVEGLNAVFFVLVTNQNLVGYQWYANGSPIPGPNGMQPICTVSNVTVSQNNGQVYNCVISNSLGTSASATATLNVIADKTPPTIVRVLNVGTTNIQVVYSKPVEALSATNPANYVLTDGVPITAGSLTSDNLSVILKSGPLVYGSNYTLVVNNVRDRATVPNTIAPNTSVQFQATIFAFQDIGSPPVPSAVTFVSNNALNVTAVGNGIGGFVDQFNLNFQVRVGDFDVKARIAGLSPSDVWAKAGLMARETLDPGARFASALATPAMNGSLFEWRDPAGSQAGTAGTFPINYPNTWLRLKRNGNLFTGFASYDGQNWSQLGSATISMPSQVYFGLVTTSGNTNQATVAQFRDIFDVTNATTVTVVNPHEPSGPSSRKTPIVISEIMYKPAPRADTNNLEFIEIYNSNPWFHDISGYRLVGSSLSYTFPSGTIVQGGAFLVIAASPQSIQTVYGITNILGPYTGSLKKTDTVQLIDEAGAVLLTVPYSNTAPWPVATDGTGHSLVLTRPTYGEEDPRAWDISDIVGGSPGQMEAFRPSPLRNVVINEFLAHTDPPDYDYIELYNNSAQLVDISGCILTDDPNTNKFIVPPGTVLPVGGFVFYSETNMNFRLNAAGETIYFKNPDQSRYLDAVSFAGQENGVATGRWPDGADDFYRLSAKTPGASNGSIRPSDIVINELMYDPISGNDDDQYIELYNRSTNPVDLGGWQLSDAVSFTFPTNTVLNPDSYLVVARNAAHLRTNYSNLTVANCLGDYSGKLSHNGEHLALTMPDTVVQTNSQGIVATNLIHITVNDLAYGTGGRWGQWSAGGGSSLELVDPNANNRLAANWADSDETQKSSWVNIETTGILDNGQNYDPSIDYAQIGLLDVGECLVDNIEVVPASTGVNLVANPDFESGLGNWSLQGCHFRSSLENTGYASSHSLHIRSSDRFWTGDNSCQVALSANSLAGGQTATLRFKARWLHGWPEVLLRLNGNWLEATGPMPVPSNLGTPGAKNSRYAGNAGPAIYSVTHSPSVPAANQPVVVTARVHDPDGVQTLVLSYRIDPSTTPIAVAMSDNGAGGDAIPGDNTFSATIPGQGAGTIVAFSISATDTRSATSRFPALQNDNAPAHECVVMFGDSNPLGSFPVYHLWITQTNVTRWINLSDLSNESHDCTIVNGTRVIYNAQGRFAGSPYHQGFDSPYGSLCHYKWIFPDDDKFLGATSFNKIHQPGNGAGDDGSIQREQIANTFLRALGVPWLYRHHVAVYVNGVRRGTLMEDAQTPDADVVKEHFPNDAGGWLYKMQPWFEFGPFPQGNAIPFNNNSWCNMMPYTTTGGVKKTARYRYNFLVRRTPTSANDFTNVFSLVDAANSYGSPSYVPSMQNLANMENWTRVFAANHAAGNWDAYGCNNAQNLYGYIGTLGTKYSLLMFDFNIVIGNSGSWGPGEALFSVNGQDPNTQNIYNEPTFRRMYWRALQELVNGPLDVANSGPLMDAKYAAFAANGLNVENPNSSIKSWLTSAKASIASQLAAENAAGFSLNNTVGLANNVGYVTGIAPVNVKTILINGVAYPVTWTSVTGFRIAVPLSPGANLLSVVGIDMHGQPISGASNVVSVVYNGSSTTPVGQVVINEILFNPAIPGSEFVELYNNSTTTTFDLSGWQFKGLSYTFPSGSLLAPNGYLVLAANAAAYAAAYGATTPLFDTFTGSLQTDGETLTLIQPGLTASNDVVIAKVRYDANAPWPSAAVGGSSLQLIDAHQDNWRAGNWAVALAKPTATPGAANNVARTLPAFQPLWINELQADNLSGISNSAGQRTAWVELYNPGSVAIPLSGLFLANNYGNLTQWSFPLNSSINPGQFKIIFADGNTNLSTLAELHTSFVLPSSAGSLVLSRLTNSQVQVLDYVDYTNVPVDYSYGSLPNGQSFDRQLFFQGTPGSSNGIAQPAASYIPYPSVGSIYHQDFDSLPNPGSTSVNCANPVTISGITYSLADPYDFSAPAIVTGNMGGLGIPNLAGWFGWGGTGSKFGATYGDQTTGGQVSFGLPASSNRALGLLSTSSTGPTAFGARFINLTPNTLTRISLQATGELWRQSDLPKTLQCFYFIDSSGTNQLSTNVTAFVPQLNVSFPTAPGDVGGVAVDGTSPANQASLSVVDLPITNWPPGAALWLVWEMADSSGKAQGLGIDNVTFSASNQSTANEIPVAITIQGTNVLLGWQSILGQTYQMEYKDDLKAPVWLALGNPIPGTGNPIIITNAINASAERFFRLQLLP